MAETEHAERIEWTRKSIDRVEGLVLKNAFSCRTPEATETSVAYTRFLRLAKMTNENYPVFLSLLEIENHYVIDSLIGDEDPFVFFTPIQPTRHLLQDCFKLLTYWHPGGIYPKTISIVLGVLQAEKAIDNRNIPIRAGSFDHQGAQVDDGQDLGELIEDYHDRDGDGLYEVFAF